MLLSHERASVTRQSASRIPHGGLVAFCSSAVYLFLKVPVMLGTPIIPKTPIVLKTPAVINKFPVYGPLFSLLQQVLLTPLLTFCATPSIIDHCSYVASCFRHQLGGLASLFYLSLSWPSGELCGGGQGPPSMIKYSFLGRHSNG